MKIGLIDVDGHNYPNLPLMKISAYHKSKGDTVEWYEPLFSGHMDIVYMSKVFSFTPDYEHFIDADVIRKGGTGYCISLKDGKEVFDKSKNHNMPDEIEHMYPDYELYGIEDKAMGFLTRGCPRGCFFCHVKDKEGKGAYKVADLKEFWNGQSYIELLDPNILACKDRAELIEQLIESKAKVEFNQGLDVRLMTDEVIELLNRVKLAAVHFAWDRYQDKDIVIPAFKRCAEKFKVRPRHISVYVLTNYDTTIEQDLERVMTLREMGYCPYIMRYNKESIQRGSELNSLARWCNNRAMFWKYKDFEDYKENNRKK